jgi:hypothetical protein
MFVINGIPLPTNHNYEIVGGAKIHIWVMDSSIESARRRAFDYINEYLWQPQDIEYEFEISQEQLLNLHSSEALLYQKALRNDLAAEFVAWPKVDGQNGDSVLVGRP